MSDSPLQDKLDAIKAGFSKQAPQEALDLMHTSTQALIDSGLANQSLKKGDIIPLFSLPNSKGANVSMSDLFDQGPLVISFFRGFW